MPREAMNHIAPVFRKGARRDCFIRCRRKRPNTLPPLGELK